MPWVCAPCRALSPCHWWLCCAQPAHAAQPICMRRSGAIVERKVLLHKQAPVLCGLGTWSAHLYQAKKPLFVLSMKSTVAMPRPTASATRKMCTRPVRRQARDLFGLAPLGRYFQHALMACNDSYQGYCPWESMGCCVPGSSHATAQPNIPWSNRRHCCSAGSDGKRAEGACSRPVPMASARQQAMRTPHSYQTFHHQ